MQNNCYPCCTLALNRVWRPEPLGISIDSSFRSQLYFWLPFGALGVWDAVADFLLWVCWLQGWWFPLWTLSDYLPPAYSPWLARRPYLANFAQQFTGFISCLEVGGNPLIGWTSAEYGHYVVHKLCSAQTYLHWCRLPNWLWLYVLLLMHVGTVENTNHYSGIVIWFRVYIFWVFEI